jgi:lysophospholipase L1-like esterase
MTILLRGNTQTVLLQQGQGSQVTLAANTFSGVTASTTYSATLGDGTALPSWLTLDPATGILSVTNASQMGIYDVLITATDGSSRSAPAIDTLYVTNGITLAQQLPDRAFVNTSSFSFAIPVGDFSTTGTTDIRYSYEILGAIDSLTAGANGSNYAQSLMSHLWSDYATGGVGYEPFTQHGPVGGGTITTFSGHVNFLADPIPNPGMEKYSINGQGIDVVGADGKDNFTWNPGSTAWDTATVYYLQQPDGGVVTIHGAGSATPITINTAGPLALESVTVHSDRGQTDSSLTLDGMSGHVTVFGADFETAEGGARFSNIGIGGTSLANWAQLDSGFRQAWFKAMSPAVYVLDAGMNDRGTLTGPQYQALLDGILNDFHTASPNTEIILVGQNDVGSGGQSSLAAFRAVLQQEAQSRGLIYVNDMATLGDIFSAIAAGYMSDPTHPNATGNALRAASYLTALGFDPTNPTTTPEGFLAGATPGLTYAATLSDGTPLPSWLVLNGATGQF